MGRVVTVTVSMAGDLKSPGDPWLCGTLRDLGAPPGTRAVRDAVYFLELPDRAGSSDPIERFARDFLAGDAASSATVRPGIAFPPRTAGESTIVTLRRAGVMDPAVGSIERALRAARFETPPARALTAFRWRLTWDPPRERLKVAAMRLVNPLVDECHVFGAGDDEQLPNPFARTPARVVAGPRRSEVDLVNLAAGSLLELSRARELALDGDEMGVIQEYFRELGRNPTDVELEMLAQTWSEHCCHKTFTDPIHYEGERIENLLADTIFKVTRELEAPFCLSVFRDNAGVIALDDDWGLTFKVETHNHPSALEPYGGAGTGVGGVIRDTLGTGLGAEPILSTDVFCFGPLDAADESVPAGSLHPRRLLTGVVAGVRDYGNRMGIPTANGAVHFHPGYIGNPLVFCGSVGLIPRRRVAKHVRPGALVVAIGGRTGRDGIHGATFSSQELTEESETLSSGAVQIGNPIEEKKVHDALLRARDEGLYEAVTDCGAGGFSSAVGEMAREGGAEIELSAAPLKYPGLRSAEVWISESQERMVLAVPPEHQGRLFEILAEEEVEGSVLGRFTDHGMLRIRHDGELVGELSVAFLFDGRPKRARKARRSAVPAPRPIEVAPYDETLARLVAHPSIASKEAIIRQYDHEVQGRMVLRPLMGPRGDAASDGAAFDPLRDGRYTVVVGCGLNVHLGEVDAYEMGAQVVDEAVRNVVASGGTLERLALLDNFAWGDVDDPQILGAAVECARGAADAARAFGAPFISGKDSLHNVYRADGVARSIPPTLLVSALSVVAGPPRAPSAELKVGESVLLLVGPPEGWIGGSVVQSLLGGRGGEVARFHGDRGREIASWVAERIAAGEVRACHDLSEGGLAVAAAEMAMGSRGTGLEIDLAPDLFARNPRARIAYLFGEAPHRFLLEVDAPAVDRLVAETRVPVVAIGRTTTEERLRVRQGGAVLIDCDVASLRREWRSVFTDLWPPPRARS